jgi:tetratricopeptide (TPR) repeat protein
MATIAEALTLARQYQQAGDPCQAEQVYRLILQADPMQVEAHHGLGIALQVLGRLDEARASFDQVLSLQPTYAEAHNNLGNTLARQGRWPEAISHYQEALHLRPDLAGAHYNLGNALVREGKIAEAAACFRNFLALEPNVASGHYNLGNALLTQGLLDEARSCFENALRLEPRFAEAHNNLGIALSRQNEWDEAALHYEQAANLKPSYAEAHFNLGNARRNQDRVADGVACYQQALRLQPGYVAAHNNLAEAFLELGRCDDAVRHFREALRLHPDCTLAWCNLANHGLLPAPAPLDRFRTLLSNAGLSPVDASFLHFALANLLDQADACDEAFAHYRQANALRHRLFQEAGTAFDREAHGRHIKQLLTVCNGDFFARIKGFGLDSEVPVFIVGMPRSGTTLVEQLLAGHPQVFAAGELKEIGRLVSGLPARMGSAAGYPECLAGLDLATSRALAEDHLRRLAQRGGLASRIIDKMPDNYLHLGLIAALFPRARVIHCRRDPLDTCLSCYCQNFVGLNYSWDLEDLGFYYREYELLMAHWRAFLPLPLLEVGYEDLVAEPESVSRRLTTFCGLEWNERCLDFSASLRPVRTASKLQVRRPIYAHSVGRWRRYAAHLEPLRRALALPAPVPR